MAEQGSGGENRGPVVERPEVLARAEERQRINDHLIEATGAVPAIDLRGLGRQTLPRVSRTAKAILAGVALALSAAACTNIEPRPIDRGAATAGSAPGHSTASGGEPPDPDKWGKKEGALYGMADFKLQTPATKPAFDQPETEYRDTAQCEINGETYTIFNTYSTNDVYNLQFAKAGSQNPEEAMASPTADFISGLEDYGQIYDIACYKDRIIFYNSSGGLKMATLLPEGDALKAINIVELPFSSSEITILVDNGVPYLYYNIINTGRISLDVLSTLTAGMSEAEKSAILDPHYESIPELDGDSTLPAWIIPPDPVTGEGLVFGAKEGESGTSVVFAAKTLAKLKSSVTKVIELNGNPAAFYTGNVTATPVYDESGKLIKVYVTFVRQETQFGKRKLMHAVFVVEEIVEPPPDTDIAPDTDSPDAGSIGDKDAITATDDLPWELQEVGDGDSNGAPDAEPGDAEPGDGGPDAEPTGDPADPLDEGQDPGAAPTDEGFPTDEGSPTDKADPTDEGFPQDSDDAAAPSDTAAPKDATVETKDAENPKEITETQDANPFDVQAVNENLFKFTEGGCNATVKLLDPPEAKKYGIDIDGTGDEANPCVAEVEIEGSPSIMIYTFWNDADGEVKARCTIVDRVDESGKPVQKPLCDILAVNNLFDVFEAGQGTEGQVLGTVTGSSASAWTIARRQGVREVIDGTPEIVDYVEVRNNQEGTTVLMRLNENIILTLTETGIWHAIEAESGEEFEFPQIPNPPEGAESLPIGSGNPEQSDGATIPPAKSSGSEACAPKNPSESPKGSPIALLLTFIATLATRRFGRKQRA